MKATELMIGDWLNTNRSECVADYAYQKWQQVGKVKYTQEDVVAVRFDDEDDWEEFSLNEVNPIPLTEEILVKNGFSEIHHPGTGATDEYSEWFLGGIKITEWLEDWKDHHFSTGGDDCSISFNYVHQLQHLLRLVGVQRGIEL